MLRRNAAIRYFEAVSHLDVSDLLSRVRAPTLVLHNRDDSANPIAVGRELARGIPQARFVAMLGRNHIFLEQDACLPIILDEVQAFLST